MADKFRDVLRSSKIIPFGQDLDEDFQEFLSLNDEFENILLISKIKKAIKEISKFEYFKYFGTKRLNEEDVLSQDEKRNQFHRSKSQLVHHKAKFSKDYSSKSKLFLLTILYRQEQKSGDDRED